MNELATQQESFYDRISDPMTAMVKMGEFLATSGLFGCEKKEQGIVLALACMCERKNPLEIARTYHIIEGKLSMKADAMLAAYRVKGGKLKWLQADDKAAIAEFTFEGSTITISYTEDDAKAAGYIPAKPTSGWNKNRAAMLRARLSSKAVRMLCPEVNAGIYTPEEVADFDKPSTTAFTTTTGTAVEVIKMATPTVTAGPNAGQAKVKRFPAPDKPAPVEVEVVVEKPASPPQQAEPEAAATISVPAQQPQVQPTPPAGELTMEQETVKAIVGEKLPQALAWLVKNNWLSEGQTLADLKADRCEKICARPDPFLRAVEQLATAQGTTK
jgi:hypothetical protein